MLLSLPWREGHVRREDRQKAIMDLLVTARAVDTDDLAARFHVSKMTVHRDLDELERSGVLRKVRGGATVEPGTQFESDFCVRARQDGAAKARMAHAAAALVEPGMTVMVNDGSMAAELAGPLMNHAPLTVITNNAALVDALREAPALRLISLGGVYSAKYNGFFGVVTEGALARLSADLAFISTPAVTNLRAFHMDDEVVRTKRAMMDAAARSCLMINHTRFGRSALHELARLSDFDHIITDAPPDPAEVALLDGAGIGLTIASETP
ncbi:MAG: DeoR/GlpR family DNA-binding transcription regulator [Paracoccaceae bacterium]